MAFDHLREDYEGEPLSRAAIAADPIEQFRRWLADAEAAGVPLANAMTLATAGATGQPSARIVLLKGVDARGFSFFSNYESRKGLDLADNSLAALLFWWPALHRQVRIEGAVEKLDAAESDAYFATRPRASNLSAVASAQSRPVADRAALEAEAARVAAELGDAPVVRPASWGGYRLVPSRLELWQGRADRLHDRLEYQADASGSWTVDRLFP